MFTANRRTIGLLVLVLVVLFYAVGTGFPFFHRLLYVVVFLMIIGAGWAWLSLRGLQIRVSRIGDRGQVGGYLEGRVAISNHTWMPKSWLEVTEVGGSSLEPGGRGLSLDQRQVRSWRIRTHLARRGLFEGGTVRVVSQDPFGLFRMGRYFSDPHTYIVYPATQPLPNLDSRFAGLPADSRLTRYFDQVTTDVASLRPWRPGDAYRRIHWPYTARMNSPMVKEFDVGLAAQFWVLLDLHRPSHHYPADSRGNGGIQSPEDNTEELAVTMAASLAQKLMELGLPVGLAVNGEGGGLLRPDNGPDHLNRLMEVLAEAKAGSAQTLPEFIYSMRPHLNHFHSVTVITPSSDPIWITALLDLKRLNVTLSLTLVDPASFGSRRSVGQVVEAAAAELFPVYVASRGADLDEVLSRPVNRESLEDAEAVTPLPEES